MTQKLNLESGWVREISAGGYLERRITNTKPRGGSSIEWFYENYIDEDGNECTARTGEYLVTHTGEVKQQQESAKKRIDNIRNVRIACERFKWKLRANEDKARLFITLTYKENMCDTKRLYEDFRRFWQRIKRKYAIEGYLAAFEPQERGAWHCHLITIGGAEYVPNDEIAQEWGFGYTKTQSCKNLVDLGSYLTSYLINLTPNSGDDEAAKASKKNARLPLYPARFRFLRWSKGLAEPEETVNDAVREKARVEKKEMKIVKDRTFEICLPEMHFPIQTRVILYVDEKKAKKFAKRLANAHINC